MFQCIPVQMRDTVELNPAGVFLLEKLFSKAERAKLFRTWAGSASMLLKGGNAVWGEPDHRAGQDTVYLISMFQVMRMVLQMIPIMRPFRRNICVRQAITFGF